MDILSQTMYSNMKEEIGPSPENPQHSQDVVMPGFRFHPTEEELVEFYLRRKVEGKPFNIELITVVDLYRYDPWELPAFAAIGEKEWFFYVPRDRKYRNGDRPNRVTASGYWKATGADRMIRNESSRSIIGLKKTLVFYTGKAPKGKRTAWIMNEYRLPQNETEKIPRNELSLCRVYKKSGIELERSQARRTQERSETENAGSAECIEKQQMECSSSSQSEMKGAKTKPAFAVEETSSDSKRYRFGLATAPDRLLENMQGGVAEGGEGALMACSSTTSSIGCWTHNNVMQLSLASSSHIYCHPTSLPLAFEEHHKNMEMNGPSVSTFDELQHLQFSATATPPAEKLWEWDPSKGNGSSR